MWLTRLVVTTLCHMFRHHLKQLSCENKQKSLYGFVGNSKNYAMQYQSMPPELTASKNPADLDAAATCCSPSLWVRQQLSARACAEDQGARYLCVRGLMPCHFWARASLHRGRLASKGMSNTGFMCLRKEECVVFTYSYLIILV